MLQIIYYVIIIVTVVYLVYFLRRAHHINLFIDASQKLILHYMLITKLYKSNAYSTEDVKDMFSKMIQVVNLQLEYYEKICVQTYNVRDSRLLILKDNLVELLHKMRIFIWQNPSLTDTNT